MKKINEKLIVGIAIILAPVTLLIALAGLQNDRYDAIFFVSSILFIASSLTIGMYDWENE